MKLNFYILKASKKLGIDNSKINIHYLQSKLKEEYLEVYKESERLRIYKNLEKDKYLKARLNLGLELLDLIQICILGLVLVTKEGVCLLMLNKKHNEKLIKEREWKISHQVKVNIKEINSIEEDIG